MTQLRPVNYALKPAAIDKAKPHATDYSLTDGGGLYVEVLPSGSKVWRYKYHRQGKREKVTIGPYPSIGVKAARDRHEALRGQLHSGESPAQAKRRDQVERRAAEARAVDFRTVARRWMEETLFYRSAGYRAQIAR
jgi:Arm DNA-binding domain